MKRECRGWIKCMREGKDDGHQGKKWGWEMKRRRKDEQFAPSWPHAVQPNTGTCKNFALTNRSLKQHEKPLGCSRFDVRPGGLGFRWPGRRNSALHLVGQKAAACESNNFPRLAEEAAPKKLNKGMEVGRARRDEGSAEDSGEVVSGPEKASAKLTSSEVFALFRHLKL